MVQEQFIPEVQNQQPFVPQLDDATTRQYIKLYQESPNQYDEGFLNNLRNHAYHYNIPFYEGEFSIFEAIKQAGAGFIEGFTTFNLAEHPDNVYEQIARNVGHLAGFAPGIVTSPLAKIKALRATAKGLQYTPGLIDIFPKKGIPLKIAESVITPQAAKIANKLKKSSYVQRTDAFKQASDFLSTGLAQDVMTGAFNLGTASAISSVWGGVDAMMDSFFHGAIAGGVFKGIGNKITAKDPKAEKFARALAGSLFMGLPATVRGATAPEQVYEYLMGAYFGGSEVPWTKSKAAKLHKENMEYADKHPEQKLSYTMDPKNFPTWKNAEPEVRTELIKMAEAATNMKVTQRRGELGYELVQHFPEAKKKLEEVQKAKESDKLDDNYHTQLKREGKLEEHIDKLNNESKRLETDLYNTEIEFNKKFEKNVDIIGKRIDKTKKDAEKKATARAKELVREKEKIDKEIDKLQKEIDSFPDKEYDVPFNESIRKGTPIGKARQKSRELKEKRYELDKEIEAVLDSAGILKKPRKKTKEKAEENRWDFTEYYLTKEGNKLLKSDPEFRPWMESLNRKVSKLNQVELDGFKAEQSLNGKEPKKAVKKPYKKVLMTSGMEGLEQLVSKDAAKRNIQPLQARIPDFRDAGTRTVKDALVVELEPKTLESMGGVVLESVKSLNKKAKDSGLKEIQFEKYNPDTIADLRRKAVVMDKASDIVMTGKLNNRLENLVNLERLPSELAINSKKPFYVFGTFDDKSPKKWWKYNQSSKRFEMLDAIPELGNKIALFSKPPKDLKYDPVEIKAMQNLIEKQEVKLKPGELPSVIVEKESELNFDISDISTAEGFNTFASVRLSSMMKNELFRDKSWVKEFNDIPKRQLAVQNAIETAIKNVKEFTDKSSDIKGVYETRSQDWINSIERTLPANLKLPSELKGKLRQWLVVAKWGKASSLLSYNQADGLELLDPTAGYTMRRQIKKQIVPENIIEEIFKKYESEEITKPIKSEPIKGPETTENIYKSLGSKTETDIVKNVGVGGIWKAKKENDPNTIIAFRVSKTKGFLESFKEHQAVGNPINWTKLEGNRVKKGTEATKGFIDWLLGKKYTNLEQEYRKELLRAINSGELKGKKIVYYQEANRPTHATALDWFINKQTTQPATHPRYGNYTPIEISSENINNILNTNKSLASTLEAPNLLSKKATPSDPSIPITVNKIVSDYNKRYKTPEGQKTQISNLEYAGQIGAREIFKAEVNGKTALFYRSSSGTSGDYKNRIMPFLGIGGKDFQSPWFIKSIPSGRVSYEKSLKNYTPAIQEAAKKLDLNFKVPKDFVSGKEQLMNILNKSQVSQPAPIKGKPKLTAGPKMSYIDAIDFNGQDIELIRFERKLINYYLQQKDKKGDPLYKTREDAAEKAKTEKDKYIKGIVKEAYEKYDMHLWGGEGDKDRMVFVKHHPRANEVVLPEGAIPQEVFDLANSKYGLSKQQEIRGMKSNLMYHQDINGTPISDFVGKDGFINNTVKLNKRLPVILNTGWRGDKAFLQGMGLNLSNQGNFKAFITSDRKLVSSFLDASAEEMGQLTDGAIIGEMKTVQAQQKDRGYNHAQGSEKSVVLQDGLMLKHMTHVANPDFSRMMREFKTNNPSLRDGVNFIIYDSAAKQKGNLKEGDYSFKNGNLVLSGGQVFEIDPASFRYNYGVYDGPSNLGIKNGKLRGIGVAKQTLTIVNPNMDKVDKKISDDYLNTLITRSFKGENKSNKALADYMAEIDKNRAAIPGTEASIVREHFHDMGVMEIQSVLKNPRYNKMSQEIILEMLNVSREAREQLALEGESGAYRTSESMRNISDFSTSAENIIQHASSIAGEAFPIFHGKYTKEFIAKSVDNWLVNKVMNPKLKNALKGRIRPYDKYLEDIDYINFDDLLAMHEHKVKGDELVYLGDLFKPLEFFNPITNKTTTLEKVWKKYSSLPLNSKQRKEYGKLLDALTVRIPLDAPSGAQVLRFAGFTGAKDHGILMHGRAMEKLGGADLDADSASLFFGGRRNDGTGQGFKESWHKMFRNQKDEFIYRGELYDSDIASPGSSLTARLANKHGRPYIVNPTANELSDWISRYNIKNVNIAGSRPKGLSGDISPKLIKQTLMQGLKDVDVVQSGGQFGVDMIGLEVGKALNKKTGGVAPPKYIQDLGTLKYGKGRKSNLDLKTIYGLIEGKPITKIGKEGKSYEDIYSHRTEQNIINTEGTVIFAPLKRPKPSTKPSYEDVKDLHHHEVVLTPKNLAEAGINPEIYDIVQNSNNKYPYAQFSPTMRAYVGEQTAQSRALMSDVVSMTQSYRAGWSSVVSSKIQNFDIMESGTITRNSLTGKELDAPIAYRVIRRPKTSTEDKLRQLTLSSALVRFTADPANELGLVNVNKMKGLLSQAYYHPKEIEIFLGVSTNNKFVNLNDMSSAYLAKNSNHIKNYLTYQLEVKHNLAKDVVKESRTDLMASLNRAFYGMDYESGKKWSYEQKQRLIRNLEKLDESEKDTALPVLADLMKDVDYRMSVFDVVNEKSYTDLFTKQNQMLRNLPEKNMWKRLLDRTKLDYPDSKQVKFIWSKNLNNYEKRVEFAESKPEDIIKEFDKANIKRTWHEIKETMTKEEVLDKLNEVVKKGEDYLENSVWEQGGLNLIMQEYKNAIKNNQKISDKEFERMFNAAEELKIKDIASLKERRLLREGTGERSSEEFIVQSAEEAMRKLSREESLANAKKESITTNEKILEQSQMDAAISRFKETLSSDHARNMFDFLMLSSFRNKDTSAKIRKVYEGLNLPADIKRQILQNLYKREGARTGSTRTAFNSKAISSANIKRFLSAQNELYKKSSDISDIKELPNIPKKAVEHVKKFEESTFIERLDPEIEIKKILEPDIKDSIISDIIGFENLKKGNLTKEQTKDILELANLLKSDPNFNPHKFNKTLMGLYTYIDPMDPVTKTIDQWNATDVKNVINTYKQIKRGNIHKYWERKLPLLKRLSLKARNQMQFPLQVSMEQMAEDIIFLKKKGYLKDWVGKEAKEIDILYPTSWGEILQSQIYRMGSMQESHSARLANRFQEDINFLDQTKDGLALHNIAAMQIQLEQNFKTREQKDLYIKEWHRIRDLYGWRTTGTGRTPIKDRIYMLDMKDGKGRTEYAGFEVVKRVKEIINANYESLFELNSGKFETITKKEFDALSKKEQVLFDDIGNGLYKKHPLAKYTLGFYDKKQTQRKLDIDMFMRELKEAYYKGGDKALDFALNIGSDGMRHMLRAQSIEKMPLQGYIKEVYNKKTEKYETLEEISVEEYNKLPLYKKKTYKEDIEAKVRKLKQLIVPNTGYKKGYIPHFFNDTAVSEKVFLKKSRKIQEKYNTMFSGVDKNSKKYKKLMNDYVQELKSHMMSHKFANGDYNLGNAQDFNTALDALVFKEVRNNLVEGELQRLGVSKKGTIELMPLQSIAKQIGSQKARETDRMGYILDPAIHGIYIENATKNLYDTLGNLLTRDTLFRMKKRNREQIVQNPKWYNNITKQAKKGKENDYIEANEVADNLQWFWHQYTREAMGMPTVVSEAAWRNPKLHVSSTPYGWFADNKFALRLNHIADKLNLLKNKELPKELQGLDNYDVQKIGSMEARFQLATLMTHPKTPINNIFGGTMHTFESVGYEPLKKAYDYKYLESINPKLKNEAEVIKHLDEHGIQVELAKHELGLDKTLRGLKNEKFIDAVAAKTKGGEEIARAELEALKVKHGVTKPIMDIAQKFMTIPEKRLRRDAYLAHYIKAWERFGGTIKNPDSPILIEIAKKGVKATQFLYSAPFRPAFARSALGKIMTRFQLWSWNAVRFRNDVRKQAERYGYKPGSPGAKKFERMITTDLFVMALGNLFMFSLFEQVVPAPYNWLQDTADWIFGDETTRNRAFFGTYPTKFAPLQLITPPIARLPISVLREFAEDDYTKLADYYLWTMFPFGRMGRDLLHPEQNIFKNPMRIPEKMFGFPLAGLAKESKKMRESNYDPISPGKSWEIF